MKAAASDSAERLAAILEGTDDAILAKDLDALITDWNAAAQRLYGYAPEEAIGRPVALIVPPDRAGEERRILERVVREGTVARYETERVRKDGTRVAVALTVSPIRDRSGRVIGASAIARDISRERAGQEAQARFAALAEQSGDAIVALDRRMRVTAWNAAAERLYGIAAADALGRPASELVEAPAHQPGGVLERVLAGETLRYDGRRRLRDGRDMIVAVTLAPIRDATGATVGAVGVGRDVTHERRAERRTRHAARVSELLAESLDPAAIAQRLTAIAVPELADTCVVVGLDEEGGISVLGSAHVDAAQAALADRARSAYGPRVSPPGIAEEVRLSGRGVLVADVDAVGQGPVRRSLRAMRARSAMIVPLTAGGVVRGELVLIAGEGRPRYDADDLAFAEDVGARAGQALENARLHAALARAEAHFRAAFEHAPTGVALARTGPHAGRLVDVNPALCAITGYSRDELLALDYSHLLHPDDREAARQAAQWLLSGDLTHYNADRRYLHKAGHVVWVQVSAAVYGRDGDAAEAVLQVQDVTERKRFEGELQHLADHDALTGLYNRRRFLEELDWVGAYSQRYGTEAAVLVVDVDGFTAVNDNCGDSVGDELLGALAHTLHERARETDIVGRLGGDELGIILPQAGRADAQAAAEAVLSAVRGRVAVSARDRRVTVTVSVGVRLIQPDCELTAAELLADAEIAVYDAKQGGGDRAAIVGEGDVEPERVRSRRAWSGRIRTALAEDGFALYEQPILALADGRIERSELLIRMLAADGDVIPPSVFLEVAQRFGQMQAIDRWVIDHAIRLLSGRQAAGLDLGLQVNLSGDSLTDESLMDFIAGAVSNAAVDPTRLIFEVTETTAIVNVERARRLARRLSDLGCGLALDDFGSGFGSFYYLKHLPFDLVKIDGDFVRELPASRTDQLTVEAIVQIAGGLGKPTVAEFVGDSATLALVERLGVDYAQGYHIGMPRPVELQPAFAR